MRITSRVVLALSLVALALCSWLSPIDSTATKLIDSGLNRALISYATARTMNAAISFAQGTEVAIEPGGVGVNLTPGQLLDPINDLVEQFSTLMLVACVAFGAQKILISIGGFWLISLVLTSLAVGWAWYHLRERQPPAWLSKSLVIILMIRFAIPVVTIGTDQLFQKFMANDYQSSQQVLDGASAQVTELNLPESAPAEDQGVLANIWAKAKAVASNVKSTLDAKSHYKNLLQTAEQWVKHIITLIVIFLLQTLIIPVLLMWALYGVARSAVTPKQSKPKANFIA